MSDVAAFILARVEEDEVVARTALDAAARLIRPNRMRLRRTVDWSWHLRVRTHLPGGHDAVLTDIIPDALSPERVLMECAAKRAIVGMAAEWEYDPQRTRDCDLIFNWILPNIAAIWLNHPDFDPAWAAEVAG